MKTRIIAGIGAACLLGTPAWAEESLDPATLGGLDGVLAVCRQVNPAGESAYKALRASMVVGLSDQAVLALTQTAEYKEALDASSKKLGGEPREAALKDCSALVPKARSHDPQAHKHP
jgi:hypothetical protein